MIQEPFEIKVRKLMDEGCELLPKLSGSQLQTARDYHRFMMEAFETELQRRKSQ